MTYEVLLLLRVVGGVLLAVGKQRHAALPPPSGVWWIGTVALIEKYNKKYDIMN